LFVGQATLKEGSAFAFGEAVFARFAVKKATGLLAVMAANGQSTGAALAIVGAIGILTAEASQVIRDVHQGSLCVKRFGHCQQLQTVVEKRPRTFNKRGTPGITPV
jgi:hypothetical protein